MADIPPSAANPPAFLCNGSFDKAMLDRFMVFVDNLREKQAKAAVIYINSPGGYMNILESMISLMDGSAAQFATVAMGEVCSAGVMLLAHGDIRFASAHADLMFHDISGWAYGNHDQIEANQVIIRRASERAFRRFARRTKKSRTWWRAQCKKSPTRDFWLTPSRAKEFGVVDHVRMPEFEVMQTVIIR